MFVSCLLFIFVMCVLYGLFVCYLFCFCVSTTGCMINSPVVVRVMCVMYFVTCVTWGPGGIVT